LQFCRKFPHIVLFVISVHCVLWIKAHTQASHKGNIDEVVVRVNRCLQRLIVSCSSLSESANPDPFTSRTTTALNSFRQTTIEWLKSLQHEILFHSKPFNFLARKSDRHMRIIKIFFFILCIFHFSLWSRILIFKLFAQWFLAYFSRSAHTKNVQTQWTICE
jgi:hypothetical protein